MGTLSPIYCSFFSPTLFHVSIPSKGANGLIPILDISALHSEKCQPIWARSSLGQERLEGISSFLFSFFCLFTFLHLMAYSGWSKKKKSQKHNGGMIVGLNLLIPCVLFISCRASLPQSQRRQLQPGDQSQVPRPPQWQPPRRSQPSPRRQPRLRSNQQ